MTTNPSAVRAGGGQRRRRRPVVDPDAGRPHRRPVAPLAGERGREVTTTVVDLRELANEVTSALISAAGRARG